MLIDILNINDPHDPSFVNSEVLNYNDLNDVGNHFLYMTVPKMIKNSTAGKKVIIADNKEAFDKYINKVKESTFHINPEINIRYSLFYEYFNTNPYKISLRYLAPHEVNIFSDLSFITEGEDKIKIKFCIIQPTSGKGFVLNYSRPLFATKRPFVGITNDLFGKWYGSLTCEHQLISDSIEKIIEEHGGKEENSA